MRRPKLTYFDFSGSRGEECRMALHAAGVDFEDNRVSEDAWKAMKDATPFGALPVLEIEGKGMLAESNAILVCVGRAHGLHPADSWQAARHEAVMSAVEGVRHTMSATTRIKDEAEKKAAREALATGALAHFGRGVEAELEAGPGDGPFLAGAGLSVADIKLYILLRAFENGVYDHVPADLFARFGRLTKLYRAVADHPKIVEWMQRGQG